MQVYFMRHGQTDWNRELRIQGTTDIPLNKNGIEVAEITAKNVFEAGIRFDLIYSSPLVRAKKTAQIMNEYQKVSIVTDSRIAEFDFGQAEGVTYDVLKTEPKFSMLKNWFLDPEHYVAELGAESYNSFFKRLNDFLENEIKPLENKLNSVLIVCHGGVVRGLLKVMLNWDITKFAQTKIPNCGLNLVLLKNGSFMLDYTAKIFY